MRKESENRDRDRQRNRERHTETEMERFTTVFCCYCNTVYPGWLLAIPARAQATSSLEKTCTFVRASVHVCVRA